MSKQVKSVLNDFLYQKLSEYKKINNIQTDYSAIRHLIENLGDVKFSQNEVLTGNVPNDDKVLDTQPRSSLERWLRDLEKKGSKEKNLIKKNGAFHNANFLIDIKTLLAGEPDLYEVKYHVDWWYSVQAISRALARKGVKSRLVKDYETSYKYIQSKGLERKLLQNKVLH